MRLTLLAIAGTILSAAADNPLRLLAHESNYSNYSALSCIQDIDYSSPCDTNSASCWCKDIQFLNQVNHCTTDACSEPLKATLTRFQKWCILETRYIPQFECLNTPSQSTSMPTKDHGAHINLRGMINDLSKRYIDYDQPRPQISWQAIMGICAGISVAAFILLWCLKGIKRDRQNNPYRSGRVLPVYEPNRGRPPPRATQPRRSHTRAAQTTRASTPPPPYIREPEAAHVKNGSEEPGLPSYDDQARSSNAL